MGYYTDLDTALGHDEEARRYMGHSRPRRPSQPRQSRYTRCSECDYWTTGRGPKAVQSLKNHQGATGHTGEGRKIGDVKPGSKGPKKVDA